MWGFIFCEYTPYKLDFLLRIQWLIRRYLECKSVVYKYTYINKGLKYVFIVNILLYA